jgi:hypothetical protein
MSKGCRPLSKEEYETVKLSFKNLRDKCLFVLGTRTGFRISELLSLKVEDVTDGTKISKYVRVQRGYMKNKQESREIVLHEEARTAIKEYLMSTPLDEADWLFPYTRQSAHNALKKAFKTCGLSGTLATHTMRKTFAKTVFNHTNNIYKTKQALGHKDIGTTIKYIVVDQDEIDQAILKD